MITLVIHAPDYRVKEGAKRYEAVLADGIGVSYAISQRDKGRLLPDSKVVLLRKDRKRKRAEGILVELVATGKKTPQGIRTYNVHIKGLKEVPYEPEKLNRFGVAVLM